MHAFFFKDNEIGDDLKLNIFQTDKATELGESLTLKPSDIAKLQEKPSLQPDSKSESEPKLDDYDKTKGDLETPNDKISTDKNTDYRPIRVPSLDQEDAETKKGIFMVESKPGNTACLIGDSFCYHSSIYSSYPSWAIAQKWTLLFFCSSSSKKILFSSIISLVVNGMLEIFQCYL